MGWMSSVDGAEKEGISCVAITATMLSAKAVSAEIWVVENFHT